MKEIIKKLLPLWGLETGELTQIYPSAFEVGHSYVIKVYTDRSQLERNIKILAILWDCNIPVAEVVPAKTGEKYIEFQGSYFFLSKKLPGCNISDRKDEKTAWKMGRAIAQLHAAFLRCEKEVEFWDNSLLKEMKGWVLENLADNKWQILPEADYTKAVKTLESVYDLLPKQPIHRDVHFGNFLFLDGNFSGYIDFDLSQKNIRIFDICYFLAGLPAEEASEPLAGEEWIRIVRSVIAGYESIAKLSEEEKSVIPCVMECIEILFVSYFIGLKDMKHACGAYQVFRFIQTFAQTAGGKAANGQNEYHTSVTDSLT